EACPAEAVRPTAQRKSVEEVFGEVVRDRAFYESSQGGVTLSGGEPVCQPEFASALLERCAEEGMHTAVETAGCVPWGTFERAAPHTRLFLFDLKLMDSARHREVTGWPNETILDNAR